MISIAPRYAVSQVIGFIKGKGAIHSARVYGDRKWNYAGQHFSARGYLASTVSPEYIRHQYAEDRRIDQLNLM
jgi:putative transposase